MTTEAPVEGFVRIRGSRGEIIVTAKAWGAIYSQKGDFDYIGEATPADLERIRAEPDEEVDRELLERRSLVRGKSRARVVALADGDAEKARLLFEAEMSGQNRQDVLDGLNEVIDGAA